MTCAQLRTKTRTSISRKICCVRLGFQILYVVEQFSSLFSKGKYTKPMIRLPRAFRGRTAVRFPANSSDMCCVELALRRLLCTHVGNRVFLRRGFSPFINPTASPRWWAPTKAKQLSTTASPCVIWLCACVRYWPGLVYVSPSFTFALFSMQSN